MGPAVLNGGFSTFLSFILLATSDSHVFATFFKVITTTSLLWTYLLSVSHSYGLSKTGQRKSPKRNEDF
jgi:hypothetical protein